METQHATGNLLNGLIGFFKSRQTDCIAPEKPAAPPRRRWAVERDRAWVARFPFLP